MSLQTAERFADEIDNTNADLEYVEAAVSADTTIAGSSSQAPNQARVTERSPQFQTNLKAIQTKAKRKKVIANVSTALKTRGQVGNTGGDKPGDVPADKTTQVQEPTASGLTEAESSTPSEPTPTPRQTPTAGLAQASKITPADESKGLPTIEAMSATQPVPAKDTMPANTPETTPAVESALASQATLIKEAKSVDESAISEPTLESKDTAATEPLPTSKSQSIGVFTLANKAAVGIIASTTTAPPADEPAPTKEITPVDNPTSSEATLDSQNTAVIGRLPSSEAQLTSEPTTAKKTAPSKVISAAEHPPATEPLPSSEAQPTNRPTAAKKSTASKVKPAATAPPATEPLLSSEAQPAVKPAAAKRATISNHTPASTASPVIELLHQTSESSSISRLTIAKKTTASTDTPTTTAAPLIEPLHQTSESPPISGSTLAEKTTATSIIPATTYPPTTEPAPKSDASISSKPSGGSVEAIPRESAPLKDTLNRRARADSVNFIRSRTNSRSGASTPLIGPIRNIVQSEAAGHLPSPVEIDENPFELDKTPARPTKEQKGKGVVRDSPVERPKVRIVQSRSAPVDAYASPNEAWDFMFGPKPKKDEDKTLYSLAVPGERAVKGSKPTQQPHNDHSSTTRPQPSLPNTGSNIGGKKKKNNKKNKKKKMSHPERIKKYVQAAKTSARLLRYEAARSAPIDFRKLIRGSDPSSSSACPGLGESQGTIRSSPSSSSVPPSVVDSRASFQSLAWAYATHTAADAHLVKHNIFLFEKIPPIKAPSLQFPEPYHQLTEQPPIIVNHEFVVADSPAVKFTGDPNIPGDTLMHVFPSPNRRPDARSHPGHPDFVGTSLQLQYQAVEATGQTVWRHDRDLLDCRYRKCKKKCSDWNQETILCLGCGPKTHTRYCSLSHQLEDLEEHWSECGTDTMLIKQVIDHNTTPPHFARHCPAIPNLHGYNSLDRYRQRTYAMMTAGQYTLFNDDKPNTGIILIWPKSDPKHLEMSSRIERILNILLFDHKCEFLLHYFWRLIRELMIKTNQWTRSGAISLGSQFATEFQDDWTDPQAFGRRGNYLRPLCETDWDGDKWHHVHGSACVKYFEKLRSSLGEVMHMSGRGVKQMVEQYEAKYWILRAWRQRHECPYWRQRAENTGAVKVRLLYPQSMFFLVIAVLALVLTDTGVVPRREGGA